MDDLRSYGRQCAQGRSMITDTISLAHRSHDAIFNIAKTAHRLVSDRAQRDLGSEAVFPPTPISVGVA